MKNRKAASPILCALVLSLLGYPLSQVRADISNPASYAPVDRPAPLEAINNPGPAPVTPAVTSASTAAITPAPTVAKSAASTATYTVVKGDSWSSIAQKFKTTRKKLKALNNLTASTVKPGQVLVVPTPKSAKPSVAAAAPGTAKAKPHHAYLAAQPVQDFDIPASTFASCPVPLASQDDETESPASTATSEKPAPIAKLVSPAEMSAEPPPQIVATAPAPATLHLATPAPAAAPQVANTAPISDSTTRHFTSSNSKTSSNYFSGMANTSAPFTPPAPHLNNRIPNPSLTANPQSSLAASDWGSRFLQQARALGDRGIEYDEDWRPPGEARSWAMDCSNTSRYLYKVTANLDLPRTASDQYYYLHLQGKAWDVPQTSQGVTDTASLRRRLKPGDLLFWENTYRPERQPPITHVMVYLGVNEKGELLMAGSQSSRGGEHNRRNGGPDVYVFRPNQPCGGYTTWMGLVRHQGRFCAFGRPLEADPTKLSVAAE